MADFYRALISFGVLPLMAFSCATIDALRVMPPRYGEAATVGSYSVSLAASDFADVAKVVEGWALASGYQKTSCDGSTLGTPLCRRFSRDPEAITVAYSPGDNYIDVTIIDWSSSNKADRSSKALRAELGKAFGSTAVKARYEK
jgi:hypothetical protein